MEAPMAGIVTVALVLLFSRKQGWNANPARTSLLLATILFACALLFPTIATVEKSTAWLIAGRAGTALGGILLVIAMLQLEPAQRQKHERPKKRPNTSGRKAIQAAVPQHPPEPPQPPQADDPNDPYAGPHAGRS